VNDRDQARLTAMHDTLDGFEAIVAELGPEDWNRPTGCPGWRVRDVVAHVVGLESILTGGPEPDIEVPDDLPHVRDAAGAYMERHVLARRGVAPADLVAELGEVFARRRDQLAGDLNAEVPTFFGQSAPLIRSLGVRIFDIWAHEQDIRRAVGRPGHLTGPAAEAAARRLVRGLAKALPAQSGHPDATLVIDIAGDQTGRVAVDLSDGSEVADDEAPNLQMTVDFADLIPLACGRNDAPDPGRVVTVSGDEAIAASVFAGLGITP
jgi:uncharacterized protein (TIGR03083 family)